MIPSVLVVAVLVGRWWVLPAAAILWTAAVFIGGSCGPSCAPSAALLAGANAAAGVLLHKAVVSLLRRAH